MERSIKDLGRWRAVSGPGLLYHDASLPPGQGSTMMRFGLRLGLASVLAPFLITTASAQATLTDDQLRAKREVLGGAVALQYGIDNCDIETTLKQRNDVKNKIADLKQQTGMSGDFTPAEIKDMIGLKTDQDVKDFCTGLRMTLPGTIAGMLAEKPPKEWSKPAATAQAADAASAPSTPAPAASAAPATGSKVKTILDGTWEVEPVDDTPGECIVTHDYNDKNDDDAENAVIVRNHGDQALVVLSYAKWNFDAGEKVAAALVTAKSIINGDANWAADKTGKVISTVIPSGKIAALRKSQDALIVKFNNGDASFEIPRFSEALDALDACAAGK
jgi:hypothetical protein